MADALYIRKPTLPNGDWQARLPMYAAASGDAQAWSELREAFGPAVAFPDLRQAAAENWRLRQGGMYVEMESHPTLRPTHPHASGRDVLLFDPWDDGHTRSRPKDLVVFKRSLADEPGDNEVAYPAWFRRATLDLTCAPAPLAARPVVTFCGVAHRPALRREFIERMEAAPDLDCRVIRREKFCHPDHTGFLDSLRQAHFVLCPPGVGRFSYRLYETLAAGRIPVVPKVGHTVPEAVRTHSVIAFEDTPAGLLNFWHTRVRPEPERVHARNRAAWIRYASPLGALLWMAEEVRKRR